MLEDTEDGTSATTHRCIYGTQVVQLLFDFCQFRVHLEDRCLKIVDKFLFPSLDRLAYNVAATFGWCLWGDGSISLFGADGNVIALHHNQMIAPQIIARTTYRHQFFSNTFCIACSVTIFGVSRNEVGTVCAQFGSISFHLRITDVETETLVQQTNHEGCIGRTATQTSLRRNTLHQVSMDAWNSEVGSQEIISLYNEIILFVAIHSVTCNLQITRNIAREFIAHELDFKCIGQRNRVEHRFDIVVSIFPLANYI